MRRSPFRGQVHVRDAPADVCHVLNEAVNGIARTSKTARLWGNPADYCWRFICKQNFLVPYNGDPSYFYVPNRQTHPQFPEPEFLRFEQQSVWIVEGKLKASERNVVLRRRLYIGEQSASILFGEGYDESGKAIKCYVLYDDFYRASIRRGQWYLTGIENGI